MWKRKRVWSWSVATQCLLFAGNPLRGANVCRPTRLQSTVACRLSWSLASGWVEYSTTAWGGIRRRASSPGQEQHQRLMERHNVCAVCHWPPAAGFVGDKLCVREGRRSKGSGKERVNQKRTTPVCHKTGQSIKLGSRKQERTGLVMLLLGRSIEYQGTQRRKRT